MSKPTPHVAIERREAVSSFYQNKLGALVRRRVVYGAWIDLEALDQLGLKASRNKSGRAKDGAVHVEIHRIEELSR